MALEHLTINSCSPASLLIISIRPACLSWCDAGMQARGRQQGPRSSSVLACLDIPATEWEIVLVVAPPSVRESLRTVHPLNWDVQLSPSQLGFLCQKKKFDLSSAVTCTIVPLIASGWIGQRQVRRIISLPFTIAFYSCSFRAIM